MEDAPNQTRCQPEGGAEPGGEVAVVCEAEFRSESGQILFAFGDSLQRDREPQPNQVLVNSDARHLLELAGEMER